MELPASLRAASEQAWLELTKAQKVWDELRSSVRTAFGEELSRGMSEQVPEGFTGLTITFEVPFSFEGLLPIYSMWERHVGETRWIINQFPYRSSTHGKTGSPMWEVANFGQWAYVTDVDLALALAARPQFSKGFYSKKELEGLGDQEYSQASYREVVAAMCLQTVLASNEPAHPAAMALWAIEVTDALIEELEKSAKNE